ncbi:pectate lyase-like adhesive domain-containing protein [Leadbettera azotonutricia]|uniref:Polymorphic outer membrane protein n=1 Tax=Leadbettera azotonutricia (strain ATCC BAA-888 / DSM 13862 / ZAS-9) TaxID=545695 RepID=F5Y854_LEAAZ|nr:pectate lyase-like adhesive domain-containing protein [Leadbettera azotonutricia]AEF80206.1 polymorphic outer membrane protein [Leadbettera azotonutricia ZAS-9]
MSSKYLKWALPVMAKVQGKKKASFRLLPGLMALSLVLLLACLSCEQSTDPAVFESEDAITVSTYAELQRALGFFFDGTDAETNIIQGNAADGSTIKLTADLEAASSFGGLTTDVVTGATVVVRNNVIIDGNGHTIDGKGYPVFDIDNTIATIKNITVKNGGYTAKLGGVVFVEGASTLYLENVTFDGNKAKSNAESANGGGAIYLNPHGSPATPPTLIASNSTFINNEATDGNAGGAIYGVNADIQVTNSTFTGNKAGHGAAISAVGTSKLNITNSTFNTNAASKTAGAILVNHGNALTRGRNGASSVVTKVPAYLNGNTFSGNTATAGLGNDVVLGRFYNAAGGGTSFPEYTDNDKTDVLITGNTAFADLTFAQIERNALAP